MLHKLAKPALAEESTAAVAVTQTDAAAQGQEALDKAKTIVQELLESLRALIQELVEKVKTFFGACKKSLLHLAADAAEWAKGVQKALGGQLESARVAVDSAVEGAKKGGGAEGEVAAEAAAGAEGAEGVPAKALQEQPELAVSHWDAKYAQYYPLFVMGAIIGGGLGFLILRRTRDVEYAKMAVQGVKGVSSAGNVKGGAAAHPRRASPGGPLQETEVAAAVVREVLEVIKGNDQVTNALGGSLKEGRMNVRKQNKNAKLRGEFGLMGALPQAQGKATVEAVKGPNNTWRCTSISVKLPGVSNPLVIPLEAPPAEEAAAAEAEELKEETKEPKK